MAQIFKFVDTLGGARPVPGLSQGRQKHSGKNGDNGDNDQQFNQRER